MPKHKVIFLDEQNGKVRTKVRAVVRDLQTLGYFVGG